MCDTREKIETAVRYFQSLSIENVTSATPALLAQITENAEIRQKLFPNDHFQVGPWVHQVHPATIQTIFDTAYHPIYVKTDSDGSVISIAIGTTFACPVGTSYFIDYYSGSSDTGELVALLAYHFLQALAEHDKHGGKIFFMLGFPLNTDLNALKKIIWEEIGITRDNNVIQEVMMQRFRMLSPDAMEYLGVSKAKL